MTLCPFRQSKTAAAEPKGEGRAVLLIGWETDAVAKGIDSQVPRSLGVKANNLEQSQDALQMASLMVPQGPVVHVSMAEPHNDSILEPWKAVEGAHHPISILSVVPVDELLDPAHDHGKALQSVLRYLLHMRGTETRTHRSVLAVDKDDMTDLKAKVTKLVAGYIAANPSEESKWKRMLGSFESLLPRALGFQSAEQETGYLEPRGMYHAIVDGTRPQESARSIHYLIKAKKRHKVMPVEHESTTFGHEELLALVHQHTYGMGQGLGFGGTNSLNTPKRYSWAVGDPPSGPFAKLQNANPPYEQVKGLAGLKFPLRYASEVETYDRMRNEGTFFIGMCSYSDWPADLPNPMELADYAHRDIFVDPRWHDRIIGWTHIFRNADKHIPREFPRILLPESDFMNPPNYVPNPKKTYDVIYNCQSGSWQEYCRNWPLGEPCVMHMADMGLKICLVGKASDPMAPRHPNIDNTGFLQWDEFRLKMAESRFYFCPNIHDASPRVVAEALLSNLPVMLNGNICGGWHYIAPETGVTFTTFNAFKEVFPAFWAKVQKGEFKPRSWFTARHGPERAGEALAAFVDNLPRQVMSVNQLNKPAFKFAAPPNEEANAGTSYLS